MDNEETELTDEEREAFRIHLEASHTAYLYARTNDYFFPRKNAPPIKGGEGG